MPKVSWWNIMTQQESQPHFMAMALVQRKPDFHRGKCPWGSLFGRWGKRGPRLLGWDRTVVHFPHCSYFPGSLHPFYHYGMRNSSHSSSREHFAKMVPRWKGLNCFLQREKHSHQTLFQREDGDLLTITLSLSYLPSAENDVWRGIDGYFFPF